MSLIDLARQKGLSRQSSIDLDEAHESLRRSIPSLSPPSPTLESTEAGGIPSPGDKDHCVEDATPCGTRGGETLAYVTAVGEIRPSVISDDESYAEEFCASETCAGETSEGEASDASDSLTIS